MVTQAEAALRDVDAGGERRRSFLATGALVLAAVAVYAPILRYMALHWQQVADYSHGFVIVPLAIFFAWERRGDLRKAAIRPSLWGCVPLALSTVTLAIGRLGVELMNMRISFVLALIGIVVVMLGVEVFRILWFPLLFLFLMVPLPQSLVNVVAFPLQLVAADLAVNGLYHLGIPSLREGNIIHLPGTQLFVAEACSGLRSLMALITLGVVFAYFFRKSWLERAILVLSTVPIAILVNSFRVLLSGVLTYVYGEVTAEGWIHEMQGLITFSLAFALLMAEAALLARLRRPGRVRAPAT